MACIKTSKLCARVEKLCQQSDHFIDFQRKLIASNLKLYHHCCQQHQVSNFAQQYKQKNIITPSCENIKNKYRSMQTQQSGSRPDIHIDINKLISDDLKGFYDDIKKELISNTSVDELGKIATYYFDGHGKALRPMVTILMARAINCHKNKDELLQSQRQVAMIVEMIHCASLIHDDVIDQSNTRRGKPSANVVWSQKKVTMTGNFILAIASIMKARLKNDDVTLTLSKVITDLVQGELMQLGSKENETERFKHYLSKTYRKTASLIANGAKSVAMLGGANEELTDIAYQYGRNIGLAFQLIDDHLDFVSSSDKMGKPTAADLKLGLATAPVLFASEQYPELDPMIMRRFQEPGDVQRAFELVKKSQGLDQTKYLAQKHCDEAIKLARSLVDSPYQRGLIEICDLVVNREK